MSEINLLPLDLSPSRGSAKASTNLKKIIIIFFSIFLFASLLGTIVLLFFTTRVQSTVNEETVVTQKIKALQNTENTLFVLKDRADKIQIVNSDSQIYDNFSSASIVLASLPTNVSVKNITAGAVGNTFSVISADSIGMATFLSSLSTNISLKGLTISDFNFFPESGYTIRFTFL
ncbi:MAG TPA: hypothetical protein VG895_01750 [Patescibacteria group bacterium]|nr:hypothetical protein [Patescibacteria group bacterium]